MNHCQDSSELRSVEADLAQMEPSELPADFVEMCQGAMEQVEVEDQLANLVPTELSDDFITSLESVMTHADATEDSTIVEFRAVEKKSTFPMLASVAAVAMLAVMSFMVLTPKNSKPQIAEKKDSPENEEVFNLGTDMDIPFGNFSNNIVKASNEGIVLKDNKVPHKVVRIYYEEVINAVDAAGNEYEKVIPKEKVFFIQVETN